MRVKSLLILVGAVGIVLTSPSPAVAETPRSDLEITNAVQREILADQAIDLNGIDVGTHAGIVSLTGTVHDLLSKRRATRLASIVKGIDSVINQIEVKSPWSRMDWQIRRDVRDALLYNPATELYDLTVEVEEGKVTLTGEVSSLAEKNLALEIAAGVTGATEIDDQINVTYDTKRFDGEIEADVVERLAWDALVDHALTV